MREVLTSEVDRVTARLIHLRDLPTGWHSPGSSAPAREVIEHLLALAGDLAAVVGLVIVPEADGGVDLGWLIGEVEYTAQCSNDGQMFLLTDNVLTDALVEAQVAFDPAVLRAFLRQGTFPA